jgi:hypothetical protein
MCRNIRTLFNFEPPATEIEIRDAALQFVRKISGFTVPSRANEAASTAPSRISGGGAQPDPSLVTTADPRDRSRGQRARAPLRCSGRAPKTRGKREIGDEVSPSPCQAFHWADQRSRPASLQ